MSIWASAFTKFSTSISTSLAALTVGRSILPRGLGAGPSWLPWPFGAAAERVRAAAAVAMSNHTWLDRVSSSCPKSEIYPHAEDERWTAGVFTHTRAAVTCARGMPGPAVDRQSAVGLPEQGQNGQPHARRWSKGKSGSPRKHHDAGGALDGARTAA